MLLIPRRLNKVSVEIPQLTDLTHFPIFTSHLKRSISAEPDNEEPEEDSSEDESKKKKKKREAPKSLETVRSDTDKKSNAQSKPFEWSSIFGLDRKKKSTGLIFHPLEDNDRRRKRCGAGECVDEEDYSRWSIVLIIR